MRHDEKCVAQFKLPPGAGIGVGGPRSAFASRVFTLSAANVPRRRKGTKPRVSRIAVRDLLLLVQGRFEQRAPRCAASHRQSIRQYFQSECAVTHSKQTIGARAIRQFSTGRAPRSTASRAWEVTSPAFAAPALPKTSVKQNQLILPASYSKQTIGTQIKCQLFAMVFSAFSTGFFPRFLLSFGDAPRMRRLMKFALDKGTFFKPGAPRWAFLFGKGSQCRRQGEPGRSGGMIHG